MERDVVRSLWRKVSEGLFIPSNRKYPDPQLTEASFTPATLNAIVGPKMEIRFYIDPTTDSPHIWSPNISELEVEDVLTSPGEDRPGREGSRIALGQTVGGRYLKVIYVLESDPDSVFVITAYELRGLPLKAYKRRRKKKHI